MRRATPRRVVVVSAAYPVYSPFFYHPFYTGFYHPFAFGWYGWYPYPPYAYRDRTGSARLQVTPRETEVYIDGYFVGIADDYDGVFQRLRVEPGEYELQLYLEGYRTFRQKVRFTPGTTLKLVHAMEPLAPGEQNEPKPQPAASAQQAYEPGRRPSRQYARTRPAAFGTLSLGVQPDDAVVLIDGAEWQRPEGETRFLIDLPEGPHSLEVRKSGYRTYERTIHVRRGRTLTVNVALTTGGADGPAKSAGPTLPPAR